MVGKNRFTQDQGRRIAEQKKMHQTRGYVDALRLLEIGTLRVSASSPSPCSRKLPLVQPFPIAHLRQIFSVGGNVVFVVDELIADCLFGMSSGIS